MIAGVTAVGLPHDLPVTYGEECGQSPRVADLAVDEVPLAHRAQTTDPALTTEHLFHAAALHAEGFVQRTVGIGDRDRTRKESIEEHGTLFDRSLVHEDDRRVIGPLRNGVGELVDELTVEESTIVTKEHEDGRAAIENVDQTTWIDVVSVD